MVYSPRWGPGVAHRLQALAAELVEAEHRGSDLEELVGHAAAVGAEVTHYLGAAVHDARAQGTSWGEVARKTRVSEATARAKWGKRTLRRQMRQRAQQAAAVPLAVPAEAGLPTGASEHRQRLGTAVSFLLRSKEVTAQSVAREAGVSPSCLSRLLTGQRIPDWPTVFTVVTAAGGRPEEFRLLWEWARGQRQTPRSSATASLARFHGALRGLQWASGRTAGTRPPQGEGVRGDVLTAVLSGDLVPDWATTHQVVQQLGGNPAQVRPLWEDVQYTFLIAHDFFPALGVSGASDLS
ncbi:XRE family transcriptional regulator [Streptomyces sp. NPDC001401]|uniref:XRE family transcriptional regulator n=1 Tax=Streptomyces sp. NPDC001401 TaxID=3364570 RepID=UPI00368876D5